MRFMAYQHHKRTYSQTEIVPRNQLLCIYTSNVTFHNQLRPIYIDNHDPTFSKTII